MKLSDLGGIRKTMFGMRNFLLILLIGCWICVEDEDPTLVLMDDVKEDFVWEVEVAQYRTKGKWGLLNLENSVNYGMNWRV
jgi:hypothetical protein